MITGVDLVEWQLRVAAGEKLPRRQDELHPRGHAIEARLYAEDPRKGFLPSIGKLERLRLPADGGGVRVDAGVREGDTVTMFYDPMIAKVIAWDETREGAAHRLANALAGSKIAGVQTNAGFLVRALKHPKFLAGEIDTGFIPRHMEELTAAHPTPGIYARAALFVIGERGRDAAHRDPWDAQDGFRLSGEARETLEFGRDTARMEIVATHHRGGGVTLTLDGKEIQPGSHSAAMRLCSGAVAVMEQGETFVLLPHDPFDEADSVGTVSDRIVAPMPGKVIRVLVEPKAKVKRGAPLIVLEAMKMEHTLAAPNDTQIESVEASAGDQVAEGTVLVRFAKADAAA
jgi:3-methylcrotonyl-CoA carboxylase alpha subunit